MFLVTPEKPTMCLQCWSIQPGDNNLTTELGGTLEIAFINVASDSTNLA